MIFRATEQWFIAVDHDELRARTLRRSARCAGSRHGGGRGSRRWFRLRPDWCISRQRSWGVPIPALGCTGCQSQLLTAATVRHFRDLFRKEGSDVWFTRRSSSCFRPGAACPQCGGTSFRKEGDILDVWFESGSSHRAVLAGGLRPGLPRLHVPGGLGSASRLVSVVDLDGDGDHGESSVRDSSDARVRGGRAGRKISKSLGNYIPADKMTVQLRRRRAPALRRQHGLRRRHQRQRAWHQGDVGGLSQDPQYLSLPAGKPRRLSAV